MTDPERITALEQNLNRLVAAVERLVDEVTRHPGPILTEAQPEEPTVGPFRWKAPLLILGVLLVLLLAAFFVTTRMGGASANSSAGTGSSASATPLDQARDFESRKDYPRAEAAYRQILAKDPGNADAIRHLASVLFRQDKYEESAQVLKGLNSARR